SCSIGAASARSAPARTSSPPMSSARSTGCPSPPASTRTRGWSGSRPCIGGPDEPPPRAEPRRRTDALAHPAPCRRSTDRRKTMTRPRLSIAALTSATAICALALTGCGTTDTEADAQTQSTASASCAEETSASTGPVSVTDDTGHEISLDEPAAKVVSLEWQYTEDLLTLCVDPVAVADAKGFTTWDTAEDLPEGTTDVGTRQEPNGESILSADPDLLIIETTNRDDKIVGQLEDQDVPVMAMAGADAEDPVKYMKDTFTTVAEATGRTERAESFLA